MTAHEPTPSRRAPLLAVVALIVVVAAGAGAWYLFLRPSGPAPVALGSAAPVTEAPAAATADASEAPSGDASVAPSAEAPGAPGGNGIDGTWAVDPSIGSFDDFSSSFVGYRVREELASIGATEAVGRTPDVTGTLTAEGTSITAATFEADLTTLRSDEANRDRQLGRQALETGEFPTATFTLTQPIDLGSAPAEGDTFEATATGDLTLHGVTKSVSIPMQGKLENGVVTVVGSLPILFADYAIEKPTSFVVLSVEDNGTMEFQLHFSKG